MRILLTFTVLFSILIAIYCNNPVSNENSSAASIDNNKYINSDINFSVTFPHTWILSLDTTVAGMKYNLFARKPATDSAIFAITIIKGIIETNIDTIMSRENQALRLSLENYSTSVLSRVGIQNTVSGMLGFTYTTNGKRFNDSKTFSIKGKNEVIFYSSVIATPFFATGIAVRDIIASITFE